jgi:hypothetical protein
MKAVDVLDALECTELSISNIALFETDYEYAFASDLMSDALVQIEDHGENTVFLTGLCNIQSLRTAQMVDIDFIIYVRGKILDNETIEVAKNMNLNIFSTNYNMFEASGILWKKGLVAAK